ncbi:hypothetical protein M426DRAFT_317234 [Hypoxylon sp. CI-4A]|nr:hypothetical protein M426DRAFT_317234 [Hypoxylon sp. CI-4A]
MAGKKGGDSSKKAAGQARKAEAASQKNAAEDAKKAAVEDVEWEKGSKNNSKKESQAAKKAEQAAKKAERDAALAEEEKSLPSRATPKNAKTAVKKTRRGIDNALAETSLNDKLPTLDVTGIEDGIDALDIALGGPPDVKVDKHAERRVGAAYKAFEARRLEEMEEDGSGKGLRLSQKKKQIMTEFKKSPENPLNNVHVEHNATRDEIREIRERERAKTEARLTAE